MLKTQREYSKFVHKIMRQTYDQLDGNINVQVVGATKIYNCFNYQGLETLICKKIVHIL